jgi:hypothetical protein
MHQFSKLLNTTWKHRHQREGEDSKQSSQDHSSLENLHGMPTPMSPISLQNAVQHHLVG